ncbi:RNA recognition motif domain-containing protein [Candidatus Enterovibrio escicola]|nr:RNA-binding protein [Candidatus Enterovibrio escacola]
MRTFISLLITGAIAVLGGLLLNTFPLIPISVGFAFALGAVTGSIVLSIFPTKSAGTTSKTLSLNSKTIYVGNLPYRSNENDVKELFAEYGEVFAVRLMKDKRTGKRRGFGFVVIAAKDAPAAIDQLNNSAYGDRILKVREANDPRKSEHAE